PWFYFRVLAAGLLPWTGLLLGRAFDEARAAFRREDPPDAFGIVLWCWAAAIFGFFTLSRFKLDHYIFPAAPALAIICARAWADVRARTLRGMRVGARIGFHMVGPLFVIVGAGGGYFMIARLALPPGAVAVPIVLLAAGAVISALASLGVTPVPR